MAKITSPTDRRAAALDPASSYGMSVRHVIAAIRKLAACNTPVENAAKLYRGLRGVLPESFWSADEQGMVCATDPAFMSTSTAEATPIHYMAGSPKRNLLWELHARAEDDAGYHSGADVSMLSQFAGEREGVCSPSIVAAVACSCAPSELCHACHVRLSRAQCSCLRTRCLRCYRAPRLPRR